MRGCTFLAIFLANTRNGERAPAEDSAAVHVAFRIRRGLCLSCRENPVADADE